MFWLNLWGVALSAICFRKMAASAVAALVDVSGAASAAGAAVVVAAPSPPASACPPFEHSVGIAACSSRIILAPYWSEIAVAAPAGALDNQRFHLRRMEDSDDVAWVTALRALFREYFAGTGIDLTFQNVEAELKHLPGAKYTREAGGFLYTLEALPPADSSPSSSSSSAASSDDAPATTAASSSVEQPALVACVALKDLGGGIAEVKRLFVRPCCRRRDFGRLLLVQMIDVARQAGYSRVRLDTLARFGPANALYAALGFQRIAPYNYNPEPDVLYFELDGLQEEEEDGTKKYKRGRESMFELRPKSKTLSASPEPQ
jgi:GNAT superfamily N-acetyltransferase